VRLNRLLKYINTVIAILIVLAGAGVYWVAWRPLPKTSGTIAGAVSNKVTVSFDGLGEPHIEAVREGDLLFAQGYLTAQERMWQMDALRRLSAGDLCEIVGPGALESDQEVRRLRMRRIAEEAYVTLPPQDRAALAAYARGVNGYLDSHSGRFPLEFSVLGYDPQPWSVVDSILIGLQMFRDLTTTYPDELKKQSMLAGGGQCSQIGNHAAARERAIGDRVTDKLRGAAQRLVLQQFRGSGSRGQIDVVGIRECTGQNPRLEAGRADVRGIQRA